MSGSKGDAPPASQLLPLQAYNVAASMARFFFPPIPVVPSDMMDQYNDLIKGLHENPSIDKFACIKDAIAGEPEGVGEEGAAGAQGPKEQVGAGLRQLREFLRQNDPACTWAGLTRIELPERDTVIWVCPTCLMAPPSAAVGGGTMRGNEVQQMQQQFKAVELGSNSNNRQGPRPGGNQLATSGRVASTPQSVGTPPQQAARQGGSTGPDSPGCFGGSATRKRGAVAPL